MWSKFSGMYKRINGRTKHLPILVGLRVLKNQAGLLAHGHCCSAPSHTNIQWISRQLPFTVAGPRWIFTSFPIKSSNKKSAKRLAHPRQAQDEPTEKAFFAFLGGLACDLEGGRRWSWTVIEVQSNTFLTLNK